MPKNVFYKLKSLGMFWTSICPICVGRKIYQCDSWDYICDRCKREITEEVFQFSYETAQSFRKAPSLASLKNSLGWLEGTAGAA